MNTTASGLRTIPLGATVDRIYWAVPGYGTTGIEFETEHEALAHALDTMKEIINQHIEHHGVADSANHPQTIYVDLRWHMTFPNQYGVTGSDFVASRTTYDDIADAQSHLDRIKRYSKAGV